MGHSYLIVFNNLLWIDQNRFERRESPQIPECPLIEEH
jgi:hypothetical protein